MGRRAGWEIWGTLRDSLLTEPSVSLCPAEQGERRWEVCAECEFDGTVVGNGGLNCPRRFGWIVGQSERPRRCR